VHAASIFQSLRKQIKTKFVCIWLSLPILNFHVLEGLNFRRFSTGVQIQSAFIYIYDMLPYAVQVQMSTAQKLDELSYVLLTGL